MRHFPGCWVLPGGHLELGETLESGGLRELDEETGIKVDIVKDGDTIKYEYLGTQIMAPEAFYSFESCAPNKLGINHPLASHHLIFYFKVKLPLLYKEIQLRPQVSEVDGCAWLTPSQMKACLSNSGDPTMLIEGCVPKLSECSEDILSQKALETEPYNFKIQQMYPFYPNDCGEGFGKALAFCMRYMQSKQ